MNCLTNTQIYEAGKQSISIMVLIPESPSLEGDILWIAAWRRQVQFPPKLMALLLRPVNELGPVTVS